MLSRDVQNRALCAYFGFAVGDALGATTEFMRPQEIQARYRIHKNIIGGGWLNLKPGQVTDDTEMCLALGDALVEAGEMDEKRVADYFLKWMRSKPIDIGHTIRQGLMRYRMHGVFQAEPSEYAAGNGALMRNLPTIIATLGAPEKLADWSKRQGLITHNNFKSEAGMLLLSELTQSAIIFGQAAPLKTLLKPWLERHPYFDYTKYKRSYDGHIVDTIRTVLFFFFNTFDFESCLIGVVNAGGDADTNAALAGMLAAPFYGADSIPKRWLKKIDQRIFEKIQKQTLDLIKRFCGNKGVFGVCARNYEILNQVQNDEK